ncbi:MAG: hypothetical protein M5T61_21615 [Acidimicrobiia bacterium]|nr:hypothetical protein [Acidimicrobiia bacterium]
MITQGLLMVIEVRAEAVEDHLRRYLYRRDGDVLYHAHWHAQRLQSACEKALRDTSAMTHRLWVSEERTVLVRLWRTGRSRSQPARTHRTRGGRRSSPRGGEGPVTFAFRPAKRESVGLLIGLAGASGSGKTMSALGSPPASLATSRSRSSTPRTAGRSTTPTSSASTTGSSEHRSGPPPTPKRSPPPTRPATLVIVVDSASREHAGDGGLLDWHEEELQRMAGDDYQKRERVKMAAWIQPKLAHKQFVSKLLQIRAHPDPLLPGPRRRSRSRRRRQDRRQAEGVRCRPRRVDPGLREEPPGYELTLSLLLTADAPGLPKPIRLQEQLGRWCRSTSRCRRDRAPARRVGGGGSGGDVDELVQRLPRSSPPGPGKLEATSKAIEEKPRDAAWVRRQIKPRGVAGRGGRGHVRGRARWRRLPGAPSSASDDEQTRFPIPQAPAWKTKDERPDPARHRPRDRVPLLLHIRIPRSARSSRAMTTAGQRSRWPSSSSAR